MLKVFIQHPNTVQNTDAFANGEFEIKVIFLPVAQPELNPTELVWISIKRYVAAKITSFRCGM